MFPVLTINDLGMLSYVLGPWAHDITHTHYIEPQEVHYVPIDYVPHLLIIQTQQTLCDLCQFKNIS